MKVFFVRHGNTFNSNETAYYVGSKTDLPLVSMGKEQSEKVGEYFIDNNIIISDIYSGPLVRHKETASIIHSILNLSHDIYILKGLVEMDYGLWEGKTTEEIKEKYPEEYSKWNLNHEWLDEIFGISQEEFEDSLKMVISYLQNLPEDTGNVLLVSSGGVISSIPSYLSKRELISLDDHSTEDYKVKTGSISCLEYEDGKFSQIFWNMLP